MSRVGRATLRDVAEASGVSRATVSFVLNDSPNQTISPATKERVRRVAHELGYAAHGIARALREGASRIVVLELDTRFDGHYARSFVRGLDDELRVHGHVLLVRHGPHEPEADRQVLDVASPRAVLRFGEAYLSGYELHDQGGGWADGLAAHAGLQIRHLVERGHRRLALALPEGDTPLSALRLRFAAEAAVAVGIEPPAELVLPRPRRAGGEALRDFVAEHGPLDAIAAYDDEVALRAVSALHDLGWSVPDDVAVIGFDDTEYGEFVDPALTTVHIDADGHGRLAGRSALGLPCDDLAPTEARVIVRASA